MKKYITTQRYRGMTLSGPKNIPALTLVELREDNILYLENKPLHYITSQRGIEYFARNDDGKGLERFELCRKIQGLCAQHSDPNDSWGARLWDTPAMQKYRRANNDVRWLWNRKFYDASIEELEWILNYLKEA